MTLALLGMLVELANFVPAFAAAGERADDALVRVRPSHVVLIDDTLDAVRSDMFFARAAQRRIALAVFPGRTSTRELMQEIGERGIPWFELPTGAAKLADTITAAAAVRWWARGGDRRALPAAESADDGGLYFVDRSGRRWQVYDRRGSDRRQHTDGEEPAPLAPNAAIETAPGGALLPDLTRRFVADDGQSVETPLALDEVDALSAADLELQFLRAVAAA